MARPAASAYQALVELEKGSPGSPRDQLQEAARIIGLDLDRSFDRQHKSPDRDDDEDAVRAAPAPAPKEEWVLRWLLKKLKAAQNDAAGPGYRVDKASWILLRALVGRIPPKPLAGILGENKFLNILGEVLEGLGDTAHISDGLSGSVSASPSAGAESPKRGRKRKRSETTADDGDIPSCSSGRDLLFAVLEAVDQLVSLLSRVPDSQTAIRSQLKLVLRGEPALAGRILGCTLRYAGDALMQLSHAANEQQGLLHLLLSTVAIWEYRSNNAGDISGNAAFASHSLSSALRLLSNLQGLPPSADKEAIKHSLERLVVLHVILPLREHFLSLKPTQPSTESHAKPHQVRAVLGEMDSRLSSDTRGPLLPTLFDIAIRSVPRDTFRRQINEAPWLETLFVVSAARSGCSVDSENSQETDEECIPILQQLLQVAIDRKLGISLQTLAQYARRFSGLMSDDAAAIHWRLVTQLIALDADVFLPNSGYTESKILLDKLVNRITLECLRNSSLSTETYSIITTGIAIPLLRGFANARDLETFVQIWKDQIATIESARPSGEGALCCPIWEDDDFLGVYGDVVSTTFPVGHMKGRVEDLVSAISAEEDSSSSSATYFGIIFLDALLMSNSRQDGSFIDTSLFDQVLAATCSLLSSNRSVCWRWRLWRVTQNLFDKSPSSIQHVPTSLTQELLPMAVKRVQSSFENPEKSGFQTCREIFCAFRFLTFIVTRADIPKGDEYLNMLFSSYQPLLFTLGKSVKSAWDGRMETLVSPQTVAVGYLTVFIEYPAAVAKLPSDNRRLLFSTILSALIDASTAQSSFSAENAADTKSLSDQLVKVWDSFVSADWLLAAPPAVYDLVSVIGTYFSEKQSSSSLQRLLLRSLLTVPSRVIPPHLRVILLDSLYATLVQGDQTPDIELGFLAVMKRLVELPKASARIVTDWEGLWRIADSISLREAETSSSLILAFQQLHKAVVDRVMILSEDNRREYISKTFDKLSSLSGTLPSTANHKSLTYLMFCLSLNRVHTSQKELDNSKAKQVDSLREDTFQTAIDNLQSLARQAKKRPAELDETILLGVLSVLDTFPDLYRASKDARKATQKLDGCLSKSDINTHTQKLVKRRCIAQIKHSADLLPEVMSSAPSFPIDHPYAADQCAFVHGIRQQVSSMASRKRVDLVRSIREPESESDIGSGGYAPYPLVLAGIAISSFTPIESRESPEAVELSSLLTSLADSLFRCTSIESFCLATECIDLVLRMHPRCVLQWNVDNLLAAVSVCTSRSGPPIPREFAGTVYTRLTRLLGTLFGLYRKKLSGRFHLILPPLQRLLRCLFTRDSRATSSTTTTTTKSSPLASELPPWLGNMDETPLHADHAGQFCRLLTSLCDPTVSAVQLQPRGAGATGGLSDSTKKVKSLAGQYLQYVLTDYAGAQLRGHLSPATKAALLPGLYSVLDVMSRSTMRAMNAGMDSSRRAMFKGLYDDYVRFGRWNHD